MREILRLFLPMAFLVNGYTAIAGNFYSGWQLPQMDTTHKRLKDRSSKIFYGTDTEKQGQELADSLNTALAYMPDDSNKVKVLSYISTIYYQISPLKSFPYVEKGLLLSEKIQWKKGIANLNDNLGLYIEDTGNYALAREHFEKSLMLNTEIASDKNIINNLNNIGRSYQFQSDFTKATDYFFKALAIVVKIKSNDHLALVSSNLTSCFYTQKDYAKALTYAEQTLQYATLADNPNHVSDALMQLGKIKAQQKDTATVLKPLPIFTGYQLTWKNKREIIRPRLTIIRRPTVLMIPYFHRKIKMKSLD